MRAITSRRALLVLSVLVAGCLIAACGSSKSSTSASASTSTSTSASSASSRRAQLEACLKQHGVTLPSRPAGASGRPPAGGGPGFFGGGGFRGNPKDAAAFRACAANFGFRGRPGTFRLSHTAVTNYVACVRKHGYPQMPNPNFSGKGPVFPASIRSNSKFQAASRDCESMLRPAGAPNGSGGATNTTTNG